MTRDFKSLSLLAFPDLYCQFWYYFPLMLVLFVDDDHDDFEIFQDALHHVKPDGRVVHQWDCGAALNFLRKPSEPSPDYIFLDINMPIMTGDQCLRELQADSRLKKIPVIIFSTTVSEREKEKYKKLGAVNAFRKPNRFDEVVNMIRSTIP